MKVNIKSLLKRFSNSKLAADLEAAAVEAVSIASKTGVTNAKKRSDAQRQIKAMLKAKYGSLPEYLINLAIELVVANKK